MNKLSYKIGDCFGSWTIIGPDRVKNGHLQVLCRCKCGTETYLNLTSLLSGKTTMCKSCSGKSRTIKLEIGSKYKHWTVIDGPIYKNSTAYYKVKCDCGTELWKIPCEIIDPNRYFQCKKCSYAENIEKIKDNNGRIGELTLTEYTRLKNSAKKKRI